MGAYSIKELERLSGIKAHTLRIWEKRYNLFEPDRTETNIRTYSDYDLKKLLSVRLLSNNGVKISKIVSMNEQELNEQILEIEDQQLKSQRRIDELIVPMFNYDEREFNRLYNLFLEEVGLERTFEEIIYPFLEKIGVLWLCDEVSPAQEHFITNIIRNKLLVATDQLRINEDEAKMALLFLPEGEYHEIGLLFFAYLLKKRGTKVIYLGQSVPMDQVQAAAESRQFDLILTYSIIHAKDEIQEFLNGMNALPAEEIIFLENKYQYSFNLNYPQRVKRYTGYKELFD